jgi:predicted dehydrogenase
VPANLCASVPTIVDDETATFTVLGSIALQGVRLIQPTIGENIVVTGLGLIGLLTVQILRANGCNVLGIDPDAERCKLAASFGASTCCLSADEDPLGLANKLSGGRGVDGVIITASTKSNEPVHQAATMCRKRGRIVLVGVTGLELSRADFYEKELSFQVSCSYGPGRYDPAYEEQGQDYPFGFVRWTEQRNFEAILGLMASGAIDVSSLISHRFEIGDAVAAYEVLSKENPLGIVLTYPEATESSSARNVSLAATPKTNDSAKPVVTMIGAGNYASQMLIPALQASGVQLATLVSAGGVSSVHTGRKFGFAEASTDVGSAIGSADTNTVVIATRHDSHADLVCQALAAGKHVFVEKPLTVTREQLDTVLSAYADASSDGQAPIVMVGFNRRFAPHVVKLKGLVSKVSEPKSFVMTVNAGEIPADHWVHDAEQGGGRIVGEGCHFVDLLRFLAGSPISKVHAVMMGSAPGLLVRDDKVSITLEFEDGSIGTIHYLANGHRSYPKERLEVFCGGGVIELNNFRKMTGYGWPGFRKLNLRHQDKGHAAAVGAFVHAIEHGQPSPIPFDEIVEVTQATFDAVDQMRA